MAHPFWHVGCESTVPCPFASVYQLDKAELGTAQHGREKV